MKLNKDEFINNIDKLENAYFGEKFEGIKISKPVDKEYEEAIMKYLNSGEVNVDVVAWKNGKVEKIDDKYIPVLENGCYLNCYSKKIDKDHLEIFLDEVQKRWKCIKNYDDFKEIYGMIIHCGVPTNFGPVNIINLIFFLSNGTWPIYDRFARIAVEAVYRGVKPYEVKYEEMPDKNDIKAVCAKYRGYKWFLERLFGKKEIDRKTDRALWVYGHMKKDDKSEL